MIFETTCDLVPHENQRDFVFTGPSVRPSVTLGSSSGTFEGLGECRTVAIADVSKLSYFFALVKKKHDSNTSLCLRQ